MSGPLRDSESSERKCVNYGFVQSQWDDRYDSRLGKHNDFWKQCHAAVASQPPAASRQGLLASYVVPAAAAALVGGQRALTTVCITLGQSVLDQSC